MSDVGQRIVATGAIVAGIGVVIGAFGAHVLEDLVAPEMLANYETGVRYHLYHSLGMIAVGLLALYRAGAGNVSALSPATEAADPDLTRLRWAAVLMLTGIVLFSGSLYTMALTNMRWLGAVTPIGGVAFIAAWILFAWAATES